MESTAVQTTDDSGTGYQGEGARMQDVGSCAIAMGNLSVRPVTEYWTFDSRFKGTSAWGEGKAAFEQFVAPSRQRMALQVFTRSFMTCLVITRVARSHLSLSSSLTLSSPPSAGPIVTSVHRSCQDTGADQGTVGSLIAGLSQLLAPYESLPYKIWDNIY